MFEDIYTHFWGFFGLISYHYLRLGKVHTKQKLLKINGVVFTDHMPSRLGQQADE